MPVTPFHFGPAVAIKAAAPRWFSLSAFAATQVIIDAESVANILRQRYPVHTRFHTVLGATLIAFVVIAVGKRPLSWAKLELAKRAKQAATPITWSALIIGALFGGWSHVALDGIMHADVTPLAPWDSSNPLLRALTTTQLHVVCVAIGVVGLVGWWLRPKTA